MRSSKPRRSVSTTWVAVTAATVLAGAWSLGGCGPDAADPEPGPAGGNGAAVTAAQPTAPPGPEFVFPLSEVAPDEMLTTAGLGIELEYRVKSTTATHVEVVVRRLEKGVPADQGDSVETWDRNLWGVPVDGVLKNLVPSVLKVGGRSLRVWRAEFVWEHGRRVHTFHADFPVNGLVQAAQIHKGRVETEREFVVIRDSAGALESAPEDPSPPPNMRFVPPLAHVDDGETLVLGTNGLQIRYVVVGTDKQSVEVDVSKRASPDAPWGQPVRRNWHRNGFGLDGGWVAQSMRREMLTFLGQTRATWRLIARKGEERRAYWITDDMSVHGVVRVAPLGDDGEPDLRRALSFPGVR